MFESDGVPASEMTRDQLEGHVRRLQVINIGIHNRLIDCNHFPYILVYTVDNSTVQFGELVS
jgi:hypothetical protein